MTVKEYLSQGYRINEMINCKIMQAQSLRDLATNVTALLSHSPVSGTRNTHRMESTITKMVDLETEIYADIDTLVDLQAEIGSTIKLVACEESRTLLELRYLGFKHWSEVAKSMKYSKQRILQLHNIALEKISIPAKN